MRSSRATLAEETLKIIEKGGYQPPTGARVEIGHLIKKAIEDTVLYLPGERKRLVKDATGYEPSDGEPAEAVPVADVNTTPTTEVWHCTTLEAVHKLLYERGVNKVCALNFASAKNPGGGFLGGSQAQEESLARSSALYPCLTKCETYYTSNAKDKTCVYTNHIIYSPDVPVFRSDEGTLHAKPHLCSFITAPAVNFGAAEHRVNDNYKLKQSLQERAEMLLAIAAKNGHDTLVLGAWGCGVFRCPPALVADMFYSLLSTPTSPFAKLFKTIIYAVLDKGQCDLFDQVMKGGVSDELAAKLQSTLRFGSEKPHRGIEKGKDRDKGKDTYKGGNKHHKHRNNNKNNI